jgi:hypothetical protein
MIVVDDADSLLEIQREVIEIACEAECRELRRVPLAPLSTGGRIGISRPIHLTY